MEILVTFVLTCVFIYVVDKVFRFIFKLFEPTVNVSPEVKVYPSPEELALERENKKLSNWRNEQLSLLFGFKNLNKILSEKGVKQIGYKDLLNTLEWKFKRLQILVSDSFKCRDCSYRSISNHVHHTYYLQDHLPWDIASEALVTLCQTCHIKRHQIEKIAVYQKRAHGLVLSTKKYSYCDRCGGSGYLPQFNHVQDGICFKCWGDCIDKGIFENALTYFTNTSSPNYDDRMKSDCRSYLNRITIDVFKAKIEGDYGSSIKENDKSNVPLKGNDDLPF